KVRCANSLKRPPSIRLIAIIGVGSPIAEQIEYDRRTCSPSMNARSVRYCPCRKRNVSACSDGTVKRSAIASSVSERRSQIESGTYVARCSVLLESIEWLAAIVAAVEGFARGRAEFGN